MRSPAERHGRWVPLLATMLVATLCAGLGVWQLGRAQEKRALQARYERLTRDPPIEVPPAALRARDVEFRRVTAHGTFDPRYAVLVDNRVRHGTPGYYVIMPLALGGGRYVLVNRGWIAGIPDRSRLPDVRTPNTPVEVTGVAVVPAPRVFELSTQVTAGNVWQNLTIARYRSAYPVPIQPFVIRQDNTLDDGLVREWQALDFGIERHYGYAVQWFLLAATALAFYVVTHVRRTRGTRKEKQN